MARLVGTFALLLATGMHVQAAPLGMTADEVRSAPHHTQIMLLRTILIKSVHSPGSLLPVLLLDRRGVDVSWLGPPRSRSA